MAGGIGFIVARFLSGLNVGILNIKLSDAPILIYPNPIKSNATLEYTLTENENLTVSLIDLQGRQLQTFIINQDRTTGEHKEELCFDDALPAGNYVLQISNGVHQQSIKIILGK
ncbi:MAG: T9SS type A sorting domain-containing protein [Chitinophagales bacterium]|nr:T9SS type A sorting domain-containing protein [Chitinophagales bacterium]